MIQFLISRKSKALEEVTVVKSEFNANDFNEALGCCLFDRCGEDMVRNYLDSSGVSVCDFTGGEEIPRELRVNCWSVVITGSVKIFSGGEGGSVLLNVVSRRGIFDIAALTGRCGNVPQCAVITVGRCRIAFITACGIESLMRDYPQIAANCLGFFTERVGFLNRRIRTLSCGSCESKLADFLLNEFYQEGGSFVVKLKSCVELANRLGVSRASLYRALGTLEDSGIISRSGKLITILDMQGLQKQ